MTRFLYAVVTRRSFLGGLAVAVAGLAPLLKPPKPSQSCRGCYGDIYSDRYGEHSR